jgi:hypothetical protein
MTNNSNEQKYLDVDENGYPVDHFVMETICIILILSSSFPVILAIIFKFYNV